LTDKEPFPLDHRIFFNGAIARDSLSKSKVLWCDAEHESQIKFVRECLEASCDAFSFGSVKLLVILLSVILIDCG
jgi:hypothetical protein